MTIHRFSWSVVAELSNGAFPIPSLSIRLPPQIETFRSPFFTPLVMLSTLAKIRVYRPKKQNYHNAGGVTVTPEAYPHTQASLGQGT